MVPSHGHGSESGVFNDAVFRVPSKQNRPASARGGQSATASIDTKEHPWDPCKALLDWALHQGASNMKGV